MKTYDVYAIANFFIKKAHEDNVELSPMKLIKLVYIAQGLALAGYEKCLFRENIEAWKYGPVVPDLYHNLKHLGNKTVNTPFATTNDDYEYIEYQVDPTDEKALDVLNTVWSNFGKWSGTELSSWTHRKGSAWDMTYEKPIFAKPYGNPLLPHSLIKMEFDKVVQHEN